MKKVKCYIKYDDDYKELTHGKIYDVIRFIPSNIDSYYNIIAILNDKGIEEEYYLIANGSDMYFTNAITQYREEIIDGILS